MFPLISRNLGEDVSQILKFLMGSGMFHQVSDRLALNLQDSGVWGLPFVTSMQASNF